MKRFLFHIVLFLSCAVGYGQTSLSFYHLGNTTYQNSFQNPAFIPEGKVFVGLPGLSGVHVHANNKFSYSEFIVKNEVSNQIDLTLLAENLQKNNMVSIATDISLLHLGYTTNSGVHFSIFANERVEANVLYPKDLITFVDEGNVALLGQQIDISKTRAHATHFREYGLGIAAPLNSIMFGVKVKYLQGMFHASTPNSFEAYLTTNRENYSYDLDLVNGTLRTSGVEILQGNTGSLESHLISNSNQGFGLDLGFSWQLDQFNTFSASITDLGFISWKEDIKNYTLGDTTFNYSGVSLKSPGDLEQTIRDTLFSKFENRLTDNPAPFTSSLSPKILTNWAYMTPTGGSVVATYGTQIIQGQWKHLYGVGYRHPLGNYFVGSASVTRLPQQFLNLGAAVAVKGGPAQFYLAVDHIINFDLTKSKAVDFRVGVNFIFGKKETNEGPSAFANNEPTTQQAKGGKLSTWSFLGKKVRARGKDGIYTIIEKQKRRDPEEYQSNPDDQKEEE